MSNGKNPRPVVVGFDGSRVGRAALEWAMTEADASGRPVRCVVAMPPLYEPAPMAGQLTLIPDEMGHRLADEARAIADANWPGVTMHTDTPIGAAAGVLVALSRDAELVVVGRGRHRALGEVFTGSTSAQVIAHAHCPVVVVEPEQGQRHGGPVVVGFDGSPSSQAALAYAFDVASARRAPVRIVHAWWIDYYPEAFGQVGMETAITEQVRQRERALLTSAVGEWSTKYPDVVVTWTLARSRPVEALVESARDAQLIVVGSRGFGGFTGLVIGSTSQGLLHRHRPCPLAVVHTA